MLALCNTDLHSFFSISMPVIFSTIFVLSIFESSNHSINYIGSIMFALGKLAFYCYSFFFIKIFTFIIDIIDTVYHISA